jgi:hypothetical protein
VRIQALYAGIIYASSLYPEDVFMKLRKMVSLLALSALIGGSALAVQGCFEETVPAYDYGGPSYGYQAPYYPYGPATVGPPVVYGDWDEHRSWHDRDWWVSNRRPWVEEHHHEWLARPAQHDLYGHHERHDKD